MATETENTELTISQVAIQLDIPRLEVNRRIHKGDITGRKIGWFWVVESSETMANKINSYLSI